MTLLQKIGVVMEGVWKVWNWGSLTFAKRGFWFILIFEHKDLNTFIQFDSVKFSITPLSLDVNPFLARHRCNKSKVIV